MKIVILCIIFTFLIYFSYQLLELIKIRHIVRKTTRFIFRYTRKKAKERYDKAQEILKYEGRQEKEGFLYKIDMVLLQSGLTKAIPFMTAELFIVSLLIILGALFFITFIFTQSILQGIGIVMLTVICIYLAFYIIIGERYKKIENQILTLMHLMSNFGNINDDLIDILSKVHIYLENPLASAIDQCCSESTYTGDADRAIENLILKVNHPKFSEIMRNMQLSAIYDANYRLIIDESNLSIHQYLTQKKECKEIQNNGRTEMLILLAGGCLVLFMLSTFLTDPLFDLLLSNDVGILIFIYCVFVFIFSLIFLLKYDKE